MKIQIVSERRVGMPKPIVTSEGLRHVCSVYYVITRCKIGRKIVPNVTFAEIIRNGGIEVYYSSRPRKLKKLSDTTTLALEIGEETKTYKVLDYSGNEVGGIRTINLEVRETK